jgi:hypothetical protein
LEFASIANQGFIAEGIFFIKKSKNILPFYSWIYTFAIASKEWQQRLSGSKRKKKIFSIRSVTWVSG